MTMTIQEMRKLRHTRRRRVQSKPYDASLSFYERLTQKTLETHCQEVALKFGSNGDYPQEEHDKFSKLMNKSSNVDIIMKKISDNITQISIPSIWNYLTHFTRKDIDMPHIDALSKIMKFINETFSKTIIFGTLMLSIQNGSIDTKSPIQINMLDIQSRMGHNLIQFEQIVISNPYLYGPRSIPPHRMINYVFSKLSPQIRSEMHLSKYADSRYEIKNGTEDDDKKNMSERFDYMISEKFKLPKEQFEDWVNDMASELRMMLKLYQDIDMRHSLVPYLTMKAQLKQQEIERKKAEKNANRSLKPLRAKDYTGRTNKERTLEQNESSIIVSLLFKVGHQFEKPIIISEKFAKQSKNNFETAKENMKENMLKQSKKYIQEIASLYVKDRWVNIKLTNKPVIGGPEGSMLAYMDNTILAWVH